MDFSISKNPGQQNPDSYNMFQHLFGEEKTSDLWNTMSEHIKRHQMFMINDQYLLEDITLERKLGGHNGTFFHVEMSIHEAQLTKKHASDLVDSIKPAVSLHLQGLDHLLEKYKP